jgi:hypothetical protein
MKAAPELVEHTVEFTFSEKHRCSRRSPEIKVSGLPAGTNYFLVELKKFGPALSARNGRLYTMAPESFLLDR